MREICHSCRFQEALLKTRLALRSAPGDSCKRGRHSVGCRETAAAHKHRGRENTEREPLKKDFHFSNKGGLCAAINLGLIIKVNSGWPRAGIESAGQVGRRTEAELCLVWLLSHGRT